MTTDHAKTKHLLVSVTWATLVFMDLGGGSLAAAPAEGTEARVPSQRHAAEGRPVEPGSETDSAEATANDRPVAPQPGSGPAARAADGRPSAAGPQPGSGPAARAADGRPSAAGPQPASGPAARAASEPAATQRPWYRFEASLEMGLLAPLYHKYKQGADGTCLDFRAQGGQGNLFLFLRASAGVRFVDRHVVLFLYQPLTLETQQTLREDVRLEGVDFPAGTPVNFKYGFDFYRASYMYDIFRDPRFELGVGVSLQIRNADIVITSADGDLRAVSQNLGPVPLLKVRGRYTFDSGWWLGLEVDGIYASSKIVNGSSRDVTGALLDASLRAGIHLKGFMDVFLTLRYLGGGAEDGGDPDEAGDEYSRNWLHFIILSLGLGIY